LEPKERKGAELIVVFDIPKDVKPVKTELHDSPF
jgi:hypothetical protein